MTSSSAHHPKQYQPQIASKIVNDKPPRAGQTYRTALQGLHLGSLIVYMWATSTGHPTHIRHDVDGAAGLGAKAASQHFYGGSGNGGARPETVEGNLSGRTVGRA